MFSNNRVRGRVALAWALAAMAPVAGAWAQEAAKPLTLAEALDLARSGSPTVGIADAQVEAARGRQQQAGVGINPEASYAVENFSGSGAFRGMDASESTIGLSQQIELGGKREARSNTASKEVGATLVSSRIVEADLDLAVRVRFAELAAAEERLALAQAAVERASRLPTVAQSLVDAGREPPLRVLRAQARSAEGRAELNIAQALFGGWRCTFELSILDHDYSKLHLVFIFRDDRLCPYSLATRIKLAGKIYVCPRSEPTVVCISSPSIMRRLSRPTRATAASRIEPSRFDAAISKSVRLRT